MKPSLSLFLSAALLTLVLAGCDAAGSADTVILSENSPVPPTVEYTFAYETRGSDPIAVQSDGADNLGSILTENGFRREDVVSARVDSVRLERLTAKTAAPAGKVFEYLTGATAYLGANADGRRIATASVETTAKSVSLPVVGRDVTDVVKGGSTRAFLELATTPDAPDNRQDRVEVTVYFRLEVRGV